MEHLTAAVFPKHLFTKSVLKKTIFMSLPNRYLYVANAKVASTTIKRTLGIAEYRSKGYAVPDDLEHDINRVPRWQGMPGLLTSPTELTPQQLGEFAFHPGTYRFAFVRDPLARAISCYLDKIKSRRKAALALQLDEFAPESLKGCNWSFDEFLSIAKNQPDTLRDLHYRTQSLSLMTGVISYDFIGRLENLTADFQNVLAEIARRNQWKATPEIIKGLEHSTAKAEKPEISATALRLVRNIYEEDYDRFGY